MNSSELSDDDRDCLWTILEANMAKMYDMKSLRQTSHAADGLMLSVDRSSESSMGWDPLEKQNELFHEDARFILLSSARGSDVSESAEVTDRIIGFSMFRFDYEEGEKLLYWRVNLSGRVD